MPVAVAFEAEQLKSPEQAGSSGREVPGAPVDRPEVKVRVALAGPVAEVAEDLQGFPPAKVSPTSARCSEELPRA